MLALSQKNLRLIQMLMPMIIIIIFVVNLYTVVQSHVDGSTGTTISGWAVLLCALGAVVMAVWMCWLPGGKPRMPNGRIGCS